MTTTVEVCKNPHTDFWKKSSKSSFGPVLFQISKFGSRIVLMELTSKGIDIQTLIVNGT
jgi:hypothetical protein